MLKPVLAAAGLCAVGMAIAQPPELSGREISELVSGATVEIDTPTGTKLPVRYTEEGRMRGEARELAWYLGSPHDTGRWWIAGDQLCHKWIRWFGGEQQCMRLARDGRIIRWRSHDGNSGTATIVAPAMAQASTAIALPRVFPRRAAEPVPPLPAPAAAPQPREHVQSGAVATPPSSPPVGEAAITPPEPEVAPPPQVSVPPSVAAIEPPAPKLAEQRTPSPARQAEPKRPAQPLFMVANVRPDDVLNVRSGPSADFEIVGELPPGSRGIAITSECRSRWCPVQLHATSGWVNSIYLAPEAPPAAPRQGPLTDGAVVARAAPGLRDAPEAPRSCLRPAARALLARIEEKFGPVQVVSTCRPGALIAGTSQPSRHASGNAIDFNAGSRKSAILEWLIANHRSGGVMTYAGMDHIHVDIGSHFVSLAGRRHWSSWSNTRRTADD